MTNPFWPLFDLQITTPDLVLRPKTEADARQMAERLPPGLELDPSLPRQPFGDEHTARGATVYQGYWRMMGAWTPESWALSFVVFHGDDLIGSQTLEGDRFLELRVVDTASFLYPEWRGKGLGKQMRRAVLALAFGELGAEWAITSAWEDNAASLGVTRSIGYEPNGLSRHAHEGKVGMLAHFRLTRERWLESNGAAGIAISGFAPCRPLFGLDV